MTDPCQCFLITVDTYFKGFEKNTNEYKESLLYTKSCTPMAKSEEDGLQEKVDLKSFITSYFKLSDFDV